MPFGVSRVQLFPTHLSRNSCTPTGEQYFLRALIGTPCSQVFSFGKWEGPLSFSTGKALAPGDEVGQLAIYGPLLTECRIKNHWIL